MATRPANADFVLSTKVHRPPIAPEIVRRDQLVQLLAGGRDAPPVAHLRAGRLRQEYNGIALDRTGAAARRLAVAR